MKATDYLEAARAEEVAAELERDGYRVERSSTHGDDGYDIVASKGDRRVAVQVKALDSLKESASKIAQLRERARGEGFDEFRLVVVNPPREKQVRVHGLDQALLSYLSSHAPTGLSQLSPHARIDRVIACEIQGVDVEPQGIRVTGDGVVDVVVNGGAADGDEEERVDFPFAFDLDLDHSLKIVRVNEVSLNLADIEN